jgi:TonB family protein
VALGLLLRLAEAPVLPASDPQGVALVLTGPAPTLADATQTIGQANLQPAPAQPRLAVQLAAPAPLRMQALPQPHAFRGEPGMAATSHADSETKQATALAAPAPPVPAQAAQAPDSRLAMAQLEARIDDAVRRQAVMPMAAIRQRREGRAQLRFSYMDGAVDDIAVAQSSQSRLLDDAAVRAVRAARYPAPPPALRGRRMALQVWIDFRLASSPG